MSSTKFTRSTEFKCQICSQICNLSEPLDQSVYPLNVRERNKGASQIHSTLMKLYGNVVVPIAYLSYRLSQSNNEV